MHFKIVLDIISLVQFLIQLLSIDPTSGVKQLGHVPDHSPLSGAKVENA
jgi:hypothetical protein